MATKSPVRLLVFAAATCVAVSATLALAIKLHDSVQNIRGRIGRANAATNVSEYFAELSCAYLDRSDYFPYHREELNEHDPTGYRLMETVGATFCSCHSYCSRGGVSSSSLAMPVSSFNCSGTAFCKSSGKARIIAFSSSESSLAMASVGPSGDVIALSP